MRSSSFSDASPSAARAAQARRPRRALGAHALEPVAQPPGREAVVAVVGLDGRAVLGLDRGRAGELERGLEGVLVARGVPQVERPREAVHVLELLQAVALDADANALAHDGVEVDEALAAEQPVEALARASRGGP